MGTPDALVTVHRTAPERCALACQAPSKAPSSHDLCADRGSHRRERTPCPAGAAGLSKRVRCLSRKAVHTLALKWPDFLCTDALIPQLLTMHGVLSRAPRSAKGVLYTFVLTEDAAAELLRGAEMEVTEGLSEAFVDFEQNPPHVVVNKRSGLISVRFHIVRMHAGVIV